MTNTTPSATVRPLSEIAADIRKNWAKISPYAQPYVDALSKMDTVANGFFADSGEEIILRFLNNAQGWRGDNAKQIKAELKSMLPKH